jgi:hypothetical protein
MFDPWAPEFSVLREKVVEHMFLAELSRSLMLDLRMPFEVLRSEFDAFGYDLVIEANGVLRHIQLKASVASGARANVDVQLALADKPGGCVVWIFVDPETFRLGPFLWFGGTPGRSLPPLGERAVRHSRGDATGEKKVRPGLRRVPKAMFTSLATVRELATVMFEPPQRDHDQILDEHLASRGIVLDPDCPKPNLEWQSWFDSADLAYMIEGYELAEEAGLGDAFRFADRKRAEAERTGEWQGSTLELWLALFMEHRRDRWQSQGAFGIDIAPVQLPMLDELCQALVRRLARQGWPRRREQGGRRAGASRP